MRQSSAKHILFEVKFRETVNEVALHQAIGYDYFYQQCQELARQDVETFIISAQTPHANMLKELGYVQSDLPGVYHSNIRVTKHIPLLLLNELRPEPHNAFIQCFASQRRIRRAAFAQIRKIEWRTVSEALLQFIAGLQHRMSEPGDLMSMKIYDELLTPEEVMEFGKLLGDAYLASLPKEKRLAGLTPEDRLAGLAPEEMKVLMEQIEAHLQKSQQKSTGKNRRR